MTRQQLGLALGGKTEDPCTWKLLSPEVQRAVAEGYGRLLVAVVKAARRAEGGSGDEHEYDDE